MVNPYKKTASSNYITFAENEFRIAGMRDGDPMNERMANDVVDVLRCLEKQGHSGFSIHYILNLVDKLALFEPISPLTGADDEWLDITSTCDNDKHQWQNTRCFSVFKDYDPATGVTECYDIDGKVFEEPDGVRYTNKESAVPVTFPYTPSTVVVKVPKSARTASCKRLPDGHRGWFA